MRTFPNSVLLRDLDAEGTKRYEEICQGYKSRWYGYTGVYVVYRGTGVQGYMGYNFSWVTRISVYEGTRILVYKGTRVLVYEGTRSTVRGC